MRQVAWVLVIGVSLGLGAYWAADLYKAQRDAAFAMTETDDDIYTGSILFMPDRGDLCHQLLFDNQNGQVSDNGYVDCLKAAYHSPADEPKRWPNARVRVISTGFRKH